MIQLLPLIFLLTALFDAVLSSPIPKLGDDSVQFVHEQNKKRYFDYGNMGEPIRGVNIGGWLVLEPYITPSIFEAFRTNDYNDDGIPVDEYHFCKWLGYDEAQNRLVEHWDSFYTEDDFANVKKLGFNMVRIPIGYWAFETLSSDPYVTGLQESYLDKAIGWASNNGLKVWVDLHGAPGSQNGFDNSGLRGQIEFLQDENLNVTTKVIDYILKKYSCDEYLDTVIGIELINEPLGPAIDVNKLRDDYYLPAFDYARNDLKTNQVLVIHDAFEPYHFWDDFLTLTNKEWGVVVDHHHYQVFSPGELSTTMDQKINIACNWGSGTISESHWTVAGEFCAALTDCTKWLNGVGVGARYDGSYNTAAGGSYYIGSCSNNEDIDSWSDERKANTRKYIEAQLDAFELRQGWVFWCFKTENSIEWDAQKLASNGLLPQPLTDRQYPNQCGFN
ncbi:hypothetical protein Kpol_530p49 [Vanderwaltozyma polyspora DSM 70294]|uniref:glucan 1,3-beta-glucosidase n=1 Tax=Vanderwaltozyma polyspora (strain ATCC 22028 / DSM 70294 / BCRC 21397 / CBS 2163 / NBRC 10782 / NRRL Y-8283 / UCD 57-17) TaxID=436907 RepID=A7TL23_VANPO|nr:uncharacterized protein Kpol_530p49 [Vanderwaltozyma polyspora DSM 70294]EDO17079.1 hypothetical protein Kpol_530p49 [Vanderwaltozyma polyspora DSM 70294]